MFVVRVKNVQIGTVITHTRFYGVSEHIPTKTMFSEEMHRLIGKEIIVSPFPEGTSPWDTEWYMNEEEYVLFHSSWLDFEKSKTRYQILKEQV
jgi:hypothetical protein